MQISKVQMMLTLVIAVSGLTTAALAHVTLRPAEVVLSATATYTVRVPSEGSVATISAELEIPDGVTVVSVEGAPDTYEVKKTGTRISAIVWKTNIPAGERGEFKFTAQNPSQGAEIAWKAHQFFSDGTRTDWIGPKGSDRPGPLTILNAAAP